LGAEDIEKIQFFSDKECPFGRLRYKLTSQPMTNAYMGKSLMVLIAGPYRSGTNDDPQLIAANVKAMTDMALEVYRLGHLPVLGEWFALPLIEAAGSKAMGDEIFNEIFHPVAIQLIDHCDAVLRIGGLSSGADLMVERGKEKGKAIFYSKSDIAIPA
jgi:hypothetical protein